MKPKLFPQIRFIALVLSTACAANADSATWNGTTDATWATTTNWSSDPNPVPGTADTATFNANSLTVNSNTTIDLGGGVTIGSIVFDTVDVAAYTLGTGAAGDQSLTLDDSGSIVLNSGINANQTVNANLTLGADGSTQSYAINNSDSNNSISFAGGVTGGPGGIAGAKTLNINNTSNVSFSGIVSDGGASSLGIVKTGAGSLSFNVVGSTLTGGLNIQAGGLFFGGNGTANNSTVYLGDAVNTGTSVRIGVVNSTTNPASPLTVVAQTSGTATTRILGTNSSTSGQWSGPITMNDDLTVGTSTAGGFTLQSLATVNLNAKTLTLINSSLNNVNVSANGIISGLNGNVVVNNTNTFSTPALVILAADNDYTGSTTITAGKLQIGNGGATGSIASTSGVDNSGTLIFKRTGSLNQGGAITGSGLVQLTGSANVTFDKVNTYSGATSIGNAGKITVATGGSIAPVTGAALNIGFNSGAGTLQYDSAETSKFAGIIVGNGTTNVGTLNQTNGTINASSLTLSSVFSGGNGNVTIGNDSGNAAAMNLTGNATVSNASSGALSTLTVKSTGTLAISGSLRFCASTTRSANGTLTQSGGIVSAASINLSGNCQ